MPVIVAPDEYHEDDLFVDLSLTSDHELYLKVEGFNFAGSIKLKAAGEMVDDAERAGILRPGSVIVESSSGNLGVALAMISAHRGYEFICVSDPRCNLAARRMMESFGARVHMIAEPDPSHGFLGARLAYLHRLCEEDPRYVWLNQYNNPNNWRAHYLRTAPAVHQRFPRLDVLFLGAGTCGTLMGCARYFRDHNPAVHLVAVDSVGSVTFGGPALSRLIPGLGSAVPSAQLDASFVDEVVLVEEADSIRACQRLARSGFLFGGSTGTVVHAAKQWLDANGGGLTSVAVAPDLGERYLETVYSPTWVQERFPEVTESPCGEPLCFERGDPGPARAPSRRPG